MKREWKPGDVFTGRILQRDRETFFVVEVTANSRAAWGDGLHAINADGNGYRVLGIADPRPLGIADPRPLGIADPRPLVVIDPEDREQVERLMRALPNDWNLDPTDDPDTGKDSADGVQAALRSLIAPPKPEEPTGLGAVVEANFKTDEGKGFGPAHWAKAGDGSWVCLTDGHARTGTAWPFLTNVRVLSEGVQP